MKKIMILAASLALIGVGCLFGGGTPETAQPTAGTPETAPAAPEPTGPNADNPLSFDIAGGQFAVEKGIIFLNSTFTAESLASQSEECGTNIEAAHFAGILSRFDSRRGLVYTFLYNGESQEPSKYTLTVIENGPGYATLDEFENDFDVCAAGSTLYPYTLDENWLVFESGCGSGFDDGSGRPIACEIIREQVTKTLELQ